MGFAVDFGEGGGLVRARGRMRGVVFGGGGVVVLEVDGVWAG